MLPIHINKANVPRLAGIAAETIPSGAVGGIICKGFLNSDQGLFHKVIEQFTPIVLGEEILPSNVCEFLAIIHKDSTADIYINHVPALINVMAKKELKAFSRVSSRDIIDITEIHFEGINIREDDCVIYCFKIGWKFGLFFDLTPADGKSVLRTEELYKDLGRFFRYLVFQNDYSIIANNTLFDQLLTDGWFPFIQLIGGDYEKLVIAYNDEEYRDLLIEELVAKFDNEMIMSFVNYWWMKPLFQKKKSILLAGIEAYLTSTEAGYINCIKTLYSEIEGILQLNYFSEYRRKPTFKDLMAYVQNKASNKFISPNSLGFPVLLYQYFHDIIFKDFDLETGNIELSRHSSSHGIAPSQKYTRQKALQAILILDQMSFFLD
jgi:hypothetical protein